MNIWVNGCFDIVHRGHMELFKYAKEQGKFLVVGIDSDKRVKKNKGSARPINNQEDRKFFLECIKYIDKVVVFDSDYELETCVSLHNIDYLIVGSDYRDKDVIGSEYAKEVIFFDRIDNYSTTSILEKT
jgi:rfaE bifunctional protein nucleotidyltransferase chain/domain